MPSNPAITLGLILSAVAAFFTHPQVRGYIFDSWEEANRLGAEQALCVDLQRAGIDARGLRCPPMWGQAELAQFLN